MTLEISFGELEIVEDKPDLDERKVKLLQYDLGVSNTDIARALKVSVATISRHLKNQRHNEFIQRGIARCLKTSLAAIAKPKNREAA